ncbi:LytR/AlgR family response regulator transcription factor [Tenacibaculum jejuense]|uniref:Two component transcriptional regulator, LytTR family n=1 Tax=Tenacibaculum jejuense TaxID=584609 RepID=A0A238U5C3_9FLAO|nr:LytTR family DNA-binding domain-containing protein [Tenacibaculum jejuense]SNR14206.1 Two component transcriptional regulator, LytTR family [Tenacibaculum jejuense]
MIKTLLVEDKPYIRKGLMSLIEMLDKGLTIIGECGSVKEAVTVVHACKPDLIFLDINLSDGNAFDFLMQTEAFNYKVIFITAYDEYALQALKIGAIDYILKPVDVDELEVAIDKVVARNATIAKEQISKVREHIENNRLVISLQDGYRVIEINHLKFCKSDRGYTTFYLNDGKTILASKPLKFFMEQLPPSKFVRTHQSCIVNLDYVEKYDKSGMIILKCNTRLPVSIRKKEEFLSKLLNK